MAISTLQSAENTQSAQIGATSSLDRLHQAAERYGLICLSTEWLGRYASYAFRCRKAGHLMSYRGGTVLYASAMCRECDDAQQLTAVKSMAQAKGGECLEERYLPNQPMRFACAAGHQFSSKGRAVLRGVWCLICSVRKHGQMRLRKDGLLLLQERARKNGGVCLDEKYLGRFARHRFRCALGHEWEVDACSVIDGAWCKKCGAVAASQKKVLKDGLLRLQALAVQHGGICLSTAYTKSHDMYRFRCKVGHEWEGKGAYVLKGQWCDACVRGGKRLGIERMHEIAHERGGLCLSTEYMNNKTKLHWQCHRGHVWAARPACIVRGNWCPDCARQARITNRKSKAGLNYRESARHHHDSA